MRHLRRFVLMLTFCFAVHPLHSVQISPFVNYEYTSGSQNYFSHAGGGGLMVRFPRRIRFSGYFSLFTDTDYSLIQTGSLSLKGAPSPDYDLSTSLTLSGGKLKDSNTTSSSASWGMGCKRFIADQWEVGTDYRYTSGSLFSGVNREVRVMQGRRTETIVVEESLKYSYSEHSLIGSGGYEFDGKLAGLFSLFRLSVSFYSDRANTYSEGMELSYPLPRKFSVGASYTLTQNAESGDRYYLSFFASKYF